MKRLNHFLLFFLIATLAFAQRLSQPSVSILGDSYSTYEGYMEPANNRLWYIVENPRNDVTDVTQTWWHLWITQNGCKLEQNNSYSGATICHTGYDKADYSDRSFVTRMTNLGCPDIIFIFGGTNDDWAHVPMGEFQWSGWRKEQLYHFRPAMARMLDFMKKRYINTHIYFILNTELGEPVTQSCKAICQHYGIDLIELHDIDKQKGHPSQKGMKQIAEQITNYITTQNP